MTTDNKKQITEALKKHMSSLGISGNKVSKKIQNCSPATISQIINYKWLDQQNLISDEMWNRVSAYLNMGQEWAIIELPNYKRVYRIAKDCQSQSIARAISSAPGKGKSVGLQAYANSNPNVYYIECKEHWNRKVFLNKIRQAMGLPIGAENVSDICEQITSAIRVTNKPLIIIDEADKLKDTIITFFISFYNDTNKRCGFVLSGSVFFQKKMEKGVRLNKLGYAEAFSRMGGEFIGLNDIKAQDVRELCEANGLVDEERTVEIISEVVNNGHNDLRRAERMINDALKSSKVKKVA